MREYKPLIDGLKPLSDSQDRELLNEWVPRGTTSDCTVTVCACGKTHIVENYIILNVKTKELAIVGSTCIQRFEGDNFKVAYDIGRFVRGKLTNIPQSILDRAHTTWHILNVKEYKFMSNLRSKTRLTYKQQLWKNSISTKLKNHIVKLGFK